MGKLALEFSEILNASSTQFRRETHLIWGQSESHLTVTSQPPPWLRTRSSVTCPCTKNSIIWESSSPLGKMSLVPSMCWGRSEGQQDAKRGAVRLWGSCLSLRGIRGGSKERSKAQVVELGEKIKKSRNDTGPYLVSLQMWPWAYLPAVPLAWVWPCTFPSFLLLTQFVLSRRLYICRTALHLT